MQREKVQKDIRHEHTFDVESTGMREMDYSNKEFKKQEDEEKNGKDVKKLQSRTGKKRHRERESFTT